MTSRHRLAALRILVGAYAAVWSAVRAPHLLDVVDLPARRFDPVAPLAWLDGPLPAGVLVPVVLAAPLLGVAVALGWHHRWCAPALALVVLTTTSYRNSWGQIFHTENLLVLHLLVLAVAPAAAVWAVRPDPGDDDGGWAVRAMGVLTVGTYVVAGVAKVRNGGWAWLDGDVLAHHVAFDNARKELLGDVSSPFAPWLVGNGWLAAPAAWASLVVELGAPVALLGGRPARWWALTAWAFHVAVLVFMAILFPYHLLGLAMAPLLAPERPVGAALGRLGTVVSAAPVPRRPWQARALDDPGAP